METIRIDLGEGDYAVMFKDLLHKTMTAIREYHRKFQSPDGTIDQSKIDDDYEFILICKNQVQEWSFGPMEIESLANIPERKIKAIKEAILRDNAPLAATESESSPKAPISP